MSKTGRAVIDTNLLVRFLTEDDPVKAGEVKRLLLKAEEGAVRRASERGGLMHELVFFGVMLVLWWLRRKLS